MWKHCPRLLTHNNQGIQFSSKQLIPFERIIGFETLHRRVAVTGNPIALALGYGILSMFFGGILFGWIFGAGEVSAIIFGIVGSIVGAISGLQSTHKNSLFLRIFYHSVENVI